MLSGEDVPEVEPKEEEEDVELEDAPVEKATPQRCCTFRTSEMQFRRMLWLSFWDSVQLEFRQHAPPALPNPDEGACEVVLERKFY